MFYAAPVIDRGGAFVFFVFLYSLFTLHFLDCGLWEIWLDVLIIY